MQLYLKRKTLGSFSTVGELWLNGGIECFTVEDVVRKDPDPTTPQNEGKVMHRTAIPAGTYEVIVNKSPKFKKRYPRLLNVPGFTGILIHSGNTSEDTSGCIIVGEQIFGGAIVGGTSTSAFKRLLAKLEAAQAKGDKIHITITDEFPQEVKP